MTEAVASIVEQVAGLLPEEKLEVVRLVLLSLEPEDAGAEQAWDVELARRVDRIRSGEATGIPAEQVFANWRNRS